MILVDNYYQVSVLTQLRKHLIFKNFPIRQLQIIKYIILAPIHNFIAKRISILRNLGHRFFKNDVLQENELETTNIGSLGEPDII